MGCGASTSAAPTSTTAPKAFAGSPFAWLSTQARPMNKTLNNDQSTVLHDTKADSKADASGYFSHLSAACRRFQNDAIKAKELPAAPSTVLESDWEAMATTTEAYAAACLTLARTHSQRDLSRWNVALQSMDSANATLNSEVASVRTAADANGE